MENTQKFRPLTDEELEAIRDNQGIRLGTLTR